MSERILVVDDEREICDLVRVYLENEGYTVETFRDGASALARIEDAQAPAFDLALLDVMLPGTDGFTLCRKIRESHTYPVIMLTAKGEEVDRITGLTLGADDYVVKPFLPLELVARVKAQLRRYKTYSAGEGGAAGGRDAGEVLTYAGLVLDVRAHRCTLNEHELSLTPTEFSILRILLEAEGAVAEGADLCPLLQGQDAVVFEQHRAGRLHFARQLRLLLDPVVQRHTVIFEVLGILFFARFRLYDLRGCAPDRRADQRTIRRCPRQKAEDDRQQAGTDRREYAPDLFLK